MSEQPDERLADWVSFIVYGTISVLAAVGGLRLEAEALKPREAAAVLVVVALAAWMAHSLWRVVHARALQEPEPGRSHELHELLRSWPILAAGLPGVASMAVAAAGVWSVSHGLEVAQVAGVGLLFGAGLVTARLAGTASWPRQVVFVLALPAVGMTIVALEVAAHHV